MGRSFVVGGSKLLHHLLPDLIPPIDVTYTYWGLLNYLADEYRVEAPLDTLSGVWEVLRFYSAAARAIGPERMQSEWVSGQYPMNTSIPKTLDNAAISYSWYLWPDG